MIDPFTAFALAQGAVEGIKAAVALGKDIHGLIGEFSQFYRAADEVHAASTEMKMASLHKSDAQINSEALKIAMASKALRQHEKELKDLLFYSGNAEVWQEMMAERARMAKERAKLRQEEEDRKHRDREAKAALVMNTLWIGGCLAIIIPLISITFHVITNRGF
jgi:hypothetical protein